MLSPLVCKQSHVPADTHLQTCVCVCVMDMCFVQEYDNEAEHAVCDIAVHYTDTPLDIGQSRSCL